MDGSSLTDFDDFLAQESFGGQLESSSSFTISKEKALEKLSRMNLADPDEWILKMVQASVAGGCDKISFKFGRLTTQVEFFGEDFSLSPIKEALLEPNSDSGPFYKELIIGLRSLLFRSEFRVKTFDGSWFALQGATLHESEGPDQACPHLTLVVANEFTLSLRQRTNYLHLLKTRALFSSVPILVDSRPLLPAEILAATAPDFTTSHPRLTAPLLFAKFHFDEVLDGGHLVKAGGGVMTDPLRSLDYFLSRGVDPGYSPGQGHLHLEVDYGKSARKDDLDLRTFEIDKFFVNYTRLGVIAKTETHYCAVKGSLHIPADDLRSDLSGLKIKGESTASLRHLGPYFDRLESAVRTQGSRPHRYATEWGRVSAGFALLGGVAMMSALPFGVAPFTVAKVVAAAGSLGGGTQMTIDLNTKKLRGDILTALSELRRELGA